MKRAAGASPAALFIPRSGGPDTKIFSSPVPTPCPAGYTGAEEGSVNGMFRWNGGGYLLGIFAIALGSGILIAEEVSGFEDRGVEVAQGPAGPAAQALPSGRGMTAKAAIPLFSGIAGAAPE